MIGPTVEEPSPFTFPSTSLPLLAPLLPLQAPNPVNDDSKQNEIIEARPYRLLRIGRFLLSKDGYKIFVHESERKSEPRLGELVNVRIIGHNDKGELNGSFLPYMDVLQ